MAYSTVRGTFRKRLRERRESLGLTKVKLGIRAKLSQPGYTISDFENGFRFPRVETLVKLSEALDCTTDYLVGKSKHPHVGIK